MVIQHNILAMNAGRMFGITNKRQKTNTERLSSGYRINRAADDAAGLSISEKMRLRIRGLHQGTDNMHDGVSMVQSAEGALQEVTDMIHRIDELSVKAYNDTNTRSDREDIQAEIDQLKSEIARVADTVTFNEIPLLRGNPPRKVQIRAGEEQTAYNTCTLNQTKPNWVYINDKNDGSDETLSVHNYNYPQNPGPYDQMYVSVRDANGDIVGEKYYGTVKPGTGATHVGAWTNSVADNPNAMIDFSKLKDASGGDPRELYANVFSLMTSGAISVPCGTCRDHLYGVVFTGNEAGVSVTYDRYSISRQGVYDLSKDLSYTNEKGEAVNVFDKIKELMIVEDANPGSTSAMVQDLAQEISKKITDGVYNAMNIAIMNQDHFLRMQKVDAGGGLQKILLYDYRDNTALSSPEVANSRVDTNFDKAGLRMTMRYTETYMDDGEWGIEKPPIDIVCSDAFGDKISINLPNITLEYLGIEDYSVGRYEVTEKYSDDYEARIKAWENDVTKTTTSNTFTQRVKVIDKPSMPTFETSYNANGEKVTAVKSWSDPEFHWEDQTFTSYNVVVTHNSPKPEPQSGDVIRTEIYIPPSSNTDQLYPALKKVLAMRSELGATQNRLEHAIRNNMNAEENTTAAESRIRDTDMAKMMMEYARDQILEQAGISMISQANTVGQQVLSLLN